MTSALFPCPPLAPLLRVEIRELTSLSVLSVLVLPTIEYPVHDIPLSHSMYRTMFQIAKLPQIPSIRIWRPYRVTSERGAETEVVHFRGISDARGRLMVLMTHNTDIADAWEREGEDRDYFQHFSPDGYAVGINVLLYTMSH